MAKPAQDNWIDPKAWLGHFKNRFTVFSKTPGFHCQGGAWSGQMFDLLHEVRSDLGLWCQCEFATKKAGAEHGPKGECLEIDMMWFPKQGTYYDAPVLALEHEGSHDENEAAKDFWRVFQVAAPLRVFIGYSNRNQGEARIQFLEGKRFGREGDRFHMLEGGTDITLVGEYEMEDWTSWHGRVWTSGEKFELNEFIASR